MLPPLCHACNRPMRVLGLIPVEDGFRQRVFQQWTCRRRKCGLGQCVTEAGSVQTDPLERRRDAED